MRLTLSPRGLMVYTVEEGRHYSEIQVEHLPKTQDPPFIQENSSIRKKTKDTRSC